MHSARSISRVSPRSTASAQWSLTWSRSACAALTAQVGAALAQHVVELHPRSPRGVRRHPGQLGPAGDQPGPPRRGRLKSPTSNRGAGSQPRPPRDRPQLRARSSPGTKDRCAVDHRHRPRWPLDHRGQRDAAARPATRVSPRAAGHHQRHPDRRRPEAAYLATDCTGQPRDQPDAVPRAGRLRDPSVPGGRGPPPARGCRLPPARTGPHPAPRAVRPRPPSGRRRPDRGCARSTSCSADDVGVQRLRRRPQLALARTPPSGDRPAAEQVEGGDAHRPDASRPTAGSVEPA